MKKVCLLVLCLMLALSAVSFAEEPVFETLAGLEWSFSSGAGAWSTDMRILADGSFTGEYHDSEMGDYDDAYPGGTVYFCSFFGQMSIVEKTDDNTWRIRVEKLEKIGETEYIEDDIRYIPTDVYGLSEGDEMLLYRPGTPVNALPEEMQFWAHVIDQETPPTELESWFLSSVQNDSGFVGYPAVSLPNPWEDMTAEQLSGASGLSFGVPEGAEQVIYRYLRSEGLAEMQFSIGGDRFCARIRRAVPQDGQVSDISGMNYEWEHEEAVTIGGCEGTIGQARSEDTERVELCRWYDPARGLAYSLSVSSTDLNGLDLTAVAAQVYDR